MANRTILQGEGAILISQYRDETDMSFEWVDQTNILVGLAIGIITILTAIITIIRLWFNRLLKSTMFKTGTVADIEGLTLQIKTLCDKISKQEHKVEEKINSLIKEQKETAVINDISIHEIIKEMHDMKGQVNELSKLLQTVVRSSLDK